MKVAIDALYNDQACTARVAAVVFENWSDSVARETYTIDVAVTEPCVPGQFYRRELPCLVAILEMVEGVAPQLTPSSSTVTSTWNRVTHSNSLKLANTLTRTQ